MGEHFVLTHETQFFFFFFANVEMLDEIKIEVPGVCESGALSYQGPALPRPGGTLRVGSCWCCIGKEVAVRLLNIYPPEQPGPHRAPRIPTGSSMGHPKKLLYQ